MDSSVRLAPYLCAQLRHASINDVQKLEVFLFGVETSNRQFWSAGEIARRVEIQAEAVLEVLLLMSQGSMIYPLLGHPAKDLVFRDPQSAPPSPELVLFFQILKGHHPALARPRKIPEDSDSISEVKGRVGLGTLYDGWAHTWKPKSKTGDSAERAPKSLEFLAAGLAAAVVAISAWFWMKLPEPKKPEPQLTQEKIQERLWIAINRTKMNQVVYEDILGEGRKGWDGDPRYPEDKVNCVVWIRQLVSEIYGRNKTDKELVMDRLRYYKGHVSFGLRKHFGLRWMGLDPQPFIQEDLSGCGETKYRTVKLDLDFFLSAHGYKCPLYQMEKNQFEISYVSPEDFVQCAKKMEKGAYFVFGVPSEKYIEIFGKKSGPMGLVHGMVLDLHEFPKQTQERDPERIDLFHASTSSQKVEREPLTQYVDRMKYARHDGYVVYRLNPDWDFKQKPQPDEQMIALQQCEETLPERGISRSEH